MATSGFGGRRRTRSMGGVAPGGARSRVPDLELGEVCSEKRAEGEKEKPSSARAQKEEERNSSRVQKKKHFNGEGLEPLNLDEWSGCATPPSDEEKRTTPLTQKSNPAPRHKRGHRRTMSQASHVYAGERGSGGYKTSSRAKREKRRSQAFIVCGLSDGGSPIHRRRSLALKPRNSVCMGEASIHRCESLPPDYTFAKRVAMAQCAGACSKETDEFGSGRRPRLSVSDLPALQEMSTEVLASEKNQYTRDSPFVDGHDCLFRAAAFCLMCYDIDSPSGSWAQVGISKHEDVAKRCRLEGLKEVGRQGCMSMKGVDDCKPGEVLAEWYKDKNPDTLPVVLCQQYQYFLGALGDMRYMMRELGAVMQCLANAYGMYVIVLSSAEHGALVHRAGGRQIKLPEGIGDVLRVLPKSSAVGREGVVRKMSMFYDGVHFYPIRPKTGFRAQMQGKGGVHTQSASFHVKSAVEEEEKCKMFFSEFPFHLVRCNIENGTEMTCGHFRNAASVCQGGIGLEGVYLCPTFQSRCTGENRVKAFYFVRRARNDVPQDETWNPRRLKVYVFQLNRLKQSRCIAYMDPSMPRGPAKSQQQQQSLRFQLESPNRILTLVPSNSIEEARNLLNENSQILVDTLKEMLYASTKSRIEKLAETRI